MNTEAIRARCEAATEGKWLVEMVCANSMEVRAGYKTICEATWDRPSNKMPSCVRPNLFFIAAAHRDIPALLDHIAKLEAELSDAHKAMRDG